MRLLWVAWLVVAVSLSLVRGVTYVIPCYPRPFCNLNNVTIQNTINAASFNDVVQFSNGTWHNCGTITIAMDGTLEGQGKTVFDCQGSGQVFKIDQPHVPTIRNMTVMNGVGGTGGCIYSNGGSVVRNVNFTNCYSPGQNGGGLANAGYSAVYDSYFFGNTAGLSGGGVFCSSGCLVQNTVFSKNVATVSGGAMYYGDYGFALNVTGCTVAGNTAGVEGGGIYMQALNVALTYVGISNTIITGNVAPKGSAISTAPNPTGITQPNALYSSSPSVVIVGNTSPDDSGWQVHCDSYTHPCTECLQCFGSCDELGCRGQLTTIYVDCVRGNDANAGNTTKAPLLSVARATALAAVSNVTVNVNGTCLVNTDIDFRGKSMAFRATPGAQATLQCVGAPEFWIDSAGYATSVRTSFTNMTFVGCGAVMATEAIVSIDITNCTFRNASRVLDVSGGSRATLRSSTITMTGANVIGALISVSDYSTLAITSGVFVTNRLNGYGLLAVATHAVVTVNGSRFDDNRVDGIALGALMVSDSGSLTLNSCAVQNSYTLGSFIAASNFGAATIFSTSFSNLQSGSNGAVLSGATGALVSLRTVTFFNTSAPQNGGAVFFIGGSMMRVDGLTVTISSAVHYGGILYLEDTPTVVANAVMQEGRAEYGAAFFLFSKSLTFGINATFTSSYFNGHTASGYGGAGYVSGLFLAPSTIFTNCGFGQNTATFQGGALVLALVDALTSASFTTVTFANNLADDGGAIWSSSGKILISGSSIYQNTAAGAGGGISSLGTQLTISTTTFTSNSGNNGGSISLQQRAGFEAKDSAFSLNVAGQSGGAIYASASGLKLTDTTFDQGQAPNGGGLALDVGVTATVTGCTFTSNSAYGSGLGGAVSANQASVSISGSVFSCNTAEVQGGGFYISGHSNIQFGAPTSRFTSNSAGGDGGAMAITHGPTLSFSEIDFDNNVAGARGGSIFSMAPLSMGSVNFVNDSATTGGSLAMESGAGMLANGLSFFGSRATENGGAISAHDAGFLIFDSIFHGNLAITGAGGAFYVETTSTTTVSGLCGCVFEDNRAGGVGVNEGGGAVCAPADALTYSNVNFTNNIASGDGGGILLTAPMSNRSTNAISRDTIRFSANAARRGGGVFCPDAACADAWVHNTSYTANTVASDCYGADIATPPVSAVWMARPKVAISSGTYLANPSSSPPAGTSPFAITFELLDARGTPASCTPAAETFTINFAPQIAGATMIGATSASNLDGSALVSFYDLLFAGSPGDYSLTISSTSSIPALTASFSLLPCENNTQLSAAGQAYSTCQCMAGFSTNADFSCAPCMPGTFAATPGLSQCQLCTAATYSEPQAQRCIACPDKGADCTGGVLHRLPGWWYDTASAQFVTCANSAACPTGENATGCAAGYDEYACSSCAPGYGNIGISCVACPPVYGSVLLLALYVVVVGCYLAALIRSSNKPATTNFPYMLKIILNYIQVLSLLVNGFAIYSNTDLGVAMAPAQGASISVNIQPIDCLFGHNVYGQLLFYLLFPIAALFIITPIYAIRARVRREPIPWSHIATGAAVINSVIYPSLVSAMFKMFQCRPESGLLEADVTITCYQGNHILGAVGAAFGLAIYGVGEPVIALIVVYRSRDQLSNKAVLHRFRFLYDSYRPERFYWTILILLRKFAFVIIGTFAADTPFLQLYLGLTVLFLVSVLHLWGQPYVHDELNRTESAGLAVLLVTAVTGLILGQYPSGAGAIVAVVIIITLNAITLLIMMGLTARGSPRVRRWLRLGPNHAPAGSIYRGAAVSTSSAHPDHLGSEHHGNSGAHSDVDSFRSTASSGKPMATKPSRAVEMDSNPAFEKA